MLWRTYGLDTKAFRAIEREIGLYSVDAPLAYFTYYQPYFKDILFEGSIRAYLNRPECLVSKKHLVDWADETDEDAGFDLTI